MKLAYVSQIWQHTGMYHDVLKALPQNYAHLHSDAADDRNTLHTCRIFVFFPNVLVWATFL